MDNETTFTKFVLPFSLNAIQKSDDEDHSCIFSFFDLLMDECLLSRGQKQPGSLTTDIHSFLLCIFSKATWRTKRAFFFFFTESSGWWLGRLPGSAATLASFPPRDSLVKGNMLHIESDTRTHTQLQTHTHTQTITNTSSDTEADKPSDRHLV